MILPALMPCVLIVAATTAVASQPPKPGATLPVRITRTTKLPAGTYRVADSHDGTEAGNAAGAALVVSGNDLVVDLSGVVLRGSAADALPDARRGVGILVTGRNVLLKNAHVHGYKVGVLARNAPGLRIVGGDFSDNWKQHLQSTPEREDLADWMSFHANEKSEWLRYGAAIYLDNCDGFSVTRATARGGQNGLMLTRSNNGIVAGCDFSFLSGVGIGLYRSSGNNIQQNRIDWCVRGYSHGVYNRGQDSAGILIYEQSHKNIFAYNSVTHGGDGFFLWAGQTTMDTGKGGCNDNVVYGNDFSHAPTNGIEATFSRNVFADNKVYECWHGVWGGYSYDSQFVGNRFGYNAEAVAIEHGQNNAIRQNVFFRDNGGIRLWENATQDPNWGYPKNHDTKSHDYTITDNVYMTFKPDSYGVTQNITQANNARLDPSDSPTMLPMGAPILETEDAFYGARFVTKDWDPFAEKTGDVMAPKRLPGYPDPFLPASAMRGRRYILVDEWGPYDFKRPLLVAREPLLPDGKGRVCELLGPAGTWRVRSTSPGVSLSAQTGRIPGTIQVTLPATSGKATDLQIALEHVSGKTITPFGVSRFVAPIAWNVAFYSWEKDVSDPRTAPDAFAQRLTGTPLATLTTDRLDFAGYGKFAPNVPATYFATIADGTFTTPPGDYVLEITTDDGCRATLDDKPVLSNAWKYQGPTLYTIPFPSAGNKPHHLKIEHFQIDGYATLKVTLRKR